MNRTSTERDYVQATPLRISTKVITAHMGTTMNAKKLFDNISQILIPLWWPGEGVLKMEHDRSVIGMSSRDAFSKRGVSDKTFFNQSTIVVRKATSADKTQFKEVNVKLFGNGGIQMTGIPAEEFARETLVWLLNELKKVKGADIFGAEPNLEKFKVQLINSDYKVAHLINRTALHTILSRNYHLFSTFESTIYQGVNTKYYYNDKHPDPSRPGICLCTVKCKGQGSGSGPGECKRITMSVFQTGKIIVTGGRYMYQLEEAYNFLNKVLQKHAHEVLRLPAEEEPEPVEEVIVQEPVRRIEEAPKPVASLPIQFAPVRLGNEQTIPSANATPHMLFKPVRLDEQVVKPPVHFAPVRLKRAAKVTPVA